MPDTEPQPRAPDAHQWASQPALFRVLDHSPVPMMLFDDEWRILFVNEAGAHLLHYTPEELEGRTIDAVIPEQLRARYRQIRHELKRERPHNTVFLRGERVARTKDGREVVVEVAVSRVEVEARELQVAAFIDVSAHKQLEQETIERLHSIVEHAEVGIFLVQVEPDGTFTFESFNPVTEKLTGLRSEQARGRKPDEVVPAEEAVRVTANYRRCVALGLPITYEESPGSVVLGKSFRTTLVPIRNRSGRVHRIIGLAHDITGQKHAEQALMTTQKSLRESEERFAKAFLASPDAFVIVDGKSGAFLEVNEGFVRLFGRDRVQVIGKTSAQFQLWEDPLLAERAREILLRDRTLRDFEIVARTATGETRDCVMSAERLDIDGGWCVVASIRDITEARRAERLRGDLERQLRQNQKLDALGTLAGGIAHDFNNILGAMLAFAELINLDVNEPERIQEHLVELKRAGDRAAQLVRQILTFSRKQPLSTRRPIQLESTAREALGLVRAGLPSTITFETRLDPHAPVVLADVHALHQVLTNLCTNAAYAMRERHGVLSVRLEATWVDSVLAAANPGLQEGRYALLSVSDTGEGMTLDVQKRVFEPFFTTKGPGQGVGLGMAVIHGIVRDHDGVVTIASEPGKGTVVSVYLPEYEQALRDSSPPEPNLPRGNGECVMLVDDESVLCQSVAGLLERLGYRVEAFTEPRKALARFRQDPDVFHLVLTDLTMPGMTGIDLAREVNARGSGVPIIVMSGFVGEHSLQSLQSIGVCELLTKPLSALRISVSVRNHLGRSRTT